MLHQPKHPSDPTYVVPCPVCKREPCFSITDWMYASRTYSVECCGVETGSHDTPEAAAATWNAICHVRAEGPGCAIELRTASDELVARGTLFGHVAAPSVVEWDGRTFAYYETRAEFDDERVDGMRVLRFRCHVWVYLESTLVRLDATAFRHDADYRE